jgi:uncharacterized protein (DUF427 family)
MTMSDEFRARCFEPQPGFPMSLRAATAPVSAVFAGTTVVDAAHALVMHEQGHAPVYYFEPNEVRMDLLVRTTHSSH